MAAVSELADALRIAARAALPPVEGEVRAEGLRAPVLVARDRWGVPHITAESLHDLFFAQSYVVASDRLFQMELIFRLSLGRLSELFGELTLPIDRFVRTVGWNRAARKQAAERDDLSNEITDAAWAGFRAWIETMPAPPPEYRVLGLEPWVPGEEEAREAGAAAAVFMAWSLSRAWDNDLLRAEIAERHGAEVMRTLFPDVDPEPEAVRAAKESDDPRLAMLADAFLPPSGQGSNSWVVAGSRTASGKPLLANDPHLLVQSPSVWYEVHLQAPGIDVAGVSFPFSPGVVIGHNDRIAWGFTNTEADVQDLYLERLSEDGTGYEHGGGWEPLITHREEIAVRGRDEPEVVEVRETRHGPILTSYMLGIAEPQVVEGGIRRPYALRWVGLERTIQPSIVVRLDMARDWDEFRAALSEWSCPGQNAVYADVEGNIGYQLTGRYPKRRAGDGSLPVPGWTDEYEWDGWIPFDELPRAFNPESGYLVTANNKMVDAGYPHHLGSDFLPPYRARRVTQLITETERHTSETFARIQADTVSLPAREICALLRSVEPSTDRQKEALALLAEWDHNLAAGSAAAAVYETWNAHIARAVLRPLLDDELFDHFYARRQWTNGFQYSVLPHVLAFPTARWFGRDGADARDDVLRTALDGALDELTERLGEEMSEWRWGAIHRARFASRLAIIPDLQEMFTAGIVEVGGDEQTVNQALFEPGVPYDVAVMPSWRQILDLSDWDACLGAHTLGQSGNPESPHYRDQLELWSEVRHHAMPFSDEAVARETVAELRLLPQMAP